MPSTYPGTLDTFATNKVDGTDMGDETPGSVATGDHADHHNDLADAVNKIEAELGTNPSGAEATVAAAIAGAVPKSVIDAAGDLIVGSGADAVTRLAKGSDGQWLTVAGGALVWAAAPATAEELGYQEHTSNVSVTATTEATANTIVTAPAITFDGSTVALIEFFAPYASHATALAGMVFVLYLDGASIGFWAAADSSTANERRQVYLVRRLTPASGSRTYSVRAFTSGGTGTVAAGAGGAGVYPPLFVRIKRAA